MRILMLSGGLDSALCLWLKKPDVCLSIDYGQANAINEFRAAKELAWLHGIELQQLRFSWDHRPRGGIMGDVTASAASAVVSGRNAMFVAAAAMLGARTVTLGCNADDRDAFVDCRPEVLAPIGHACGVDVDLPLVGMTKAQVVSRCRELMVPIDRCVSCYRNGRRCGECAACILRASAEATP